MKRTWSLKLSVVSTEEKLSETGKVHMESFLKQVIQIRESHPCLNAGIDSAAQNSCAFTAATSSYKARGDLLMQQICSCQACLKVPH